MIELLISDFFLQMCLIFLLAGLVKGTIGFGLPTVGIGLGALISDIPTAMMLILVPTCLTNIVQIWGNGSLKFVLGRSWAFLIGAVLLVPIGLWIVVALPQFPFERLLGASIFIYGAISLRGFNPAIAEDYNHSIGFSFGLANSVLTGLTGSFSVPGIMYLRALHFSDDDLLCAMGVLFLVSTFAMGGSLWWLGRATQELSMSSLAMCGPVGIGVWAGTRVRGLLTETFFKKLFLYAFMTLGLYLIILGK